eukprot:11691884-Ditylum_brightwellii.AAC.1
MFNFCTVDFWGMSCNDDESQSIKCQTKAAHKNSRCGFCGPHGSYWTIDAHLQLEEAMANFSKMDATTLYSNAALASTSAMAAFAKH